MSEQCVGIAMEAHKPLSDIGQITQAMPACTPAYVECINLIAGDASGMCSRLNNTLVQATG